MIDRSGVGGRVAAWTAPAMCAKTLRIAAVAAAWCALLAWARADSPEPTPWQSEPASVVYASSGPTTSAPGASSYGVSVSAASEPVASAPAGVTVFSIDENRSFRDLVRSPAKGSKYSVLPQEKGSTSTLEWRSELATSASGSPLENVELADLIEIAQQNNYSLKNSARDVEKAMSTHRANKADFAPFAELVGNAMYSDSRVGNAPFINKVRTLTYGGELDASQLLPSGAQITTSGNVSKRRQVTIIPKAPDQKVEDYSAGVDFDITQPLLRGGGFDVTLAKVRSSRLSEMSQELSDSINRREVALDVISQFFDIAVTLSNIEVALSSMDVRQRLISETQFLVDLGMKIPSEIAKARVAYLNQEVSTISLKDRYKNQKENLLDLLGMPLDTPISFQKLTGEVLDAQMARVPDRDEALHEALANRPEVLLSTITVRSDEISLAVAKNDTLPNLDVSASYTDKETDTELRRALDLDNHRTWSTGVSLSIPLQNIRRNEARRRAELDLDTAKTNLIRTQRSVTTEVDSLLRQRSTTEESIRILRETVDQAEFTLNQETELLKWGDRTVNQVQEAQDNFFNAKSEYNRQIMDYQTLIAQIYRALGRPLF